MNEDIMNAHCEGLLELAPNMTPDKCEELELQFYDGGAPGWYLKMMFDALAKKWGHFDAVQLFLSLGYVAE